VDVTFLPLIPGWLIAAVALALFALLAHGSVVLLRKRAPGRWVVCLGVLRSVAIGLFIMCLVRPIVSYRWTVRKRPDLLVLLDTSRSMGKVVGNADASRLRQVLREMAVSGLNDALAKTFNLQWFAFDQDARPLKPAEAENPSAIGEATQLAESLQTALTYYRQAVSKDSEPNGKAGTVLLVTDGNDQGDEDVVEVARKLGLQIYAVPPPDVPKAGSGPAVTIAGVQSPRRVLLGSQCRFRVTVRHEGTENLHLALELAENDQTIAKHEFKLAADEAERHIDLTHRPVSVGSKHYAFKLSSVDQLGALNYNWPYELTVNVVTRKNRVLILEDTWRWEFKFLRRVFEDDPSFSFTAFLSRGGGTYMHFAEPDSGDKLGTVPQSRSELERFDIIMLDDINPQHWPKTLPSVIHQLVVEEGKSLVILAGPNIARLAEAPQFETLLPVEITAETAKPIEGPVNVQPSPEGTASSLFHTPRTKGKTIDWTKLPAMDQVYPPLRKRPGATILLDAPDHSNAFGNVIVMAEHTVGRGRVLFVGTDTLWKWQMLSPADAAGNTPYSIFWQQAIRALAPTPRGDADIDLFLQTDRSKYITGQTVRLRTELETDRQASRFTVDAHVTLPDGRKFPLALVPDQVHPNAFRAEFQASSPGPHHIVASVRSAGKTLADTTTTVDVQPPPDEMARLKVNTEVLRRITSRTGGRLIDLTDPSTWPIDGQNEWTAVQQSHTIDLLNDFYLVILLAMILGLDWFLRLRAGLA